MPARSRQTRKRSQETGRADLPVGPNAPQRVLTLFTERQAPARRGSSGWSGRAGARRSVLAASILAGGRSSRMGRDKSQLRIGPLTMLSHARQAAQALGLPVRVIRQDIVPSCGPLSGVLTALRTSRAESELFLACDMPFVSEALLRKLLRSLAGNRQAAFTLVNGLAGFPFVVRAKCAPVVEAQIAAKEFSLQSLARTLQASMVSPLRRRRGETFNVNTANDLTAARATYSGAAIPAATAGVSPAKVQAGGTPAPLRAVNSRRDIPRTDGRPRPRRFRPGQSTGRS